MPAGPRIRANNVFGVTTDNPLTAGATTLNSAGLANLPAVSSAHATIVLDPRRLTGAPEIVVVTAHTAAATSATISRGQYGTVAREHFQGTEWVHAPLDEDYIEILTANPSDPYEGQLWYRSDTDIYMAYTGAAAIEALPIGAWQNWTPTLTQVGAVTKTVNAARFTRLGRFIVANFQLAVTGSGTTNNIVLVGLPTPAVTPGRPVGSGTIFDSGTANYAGTWWTGASGLDIFLQGDWSGGGAWGTSPNAALANGDAVNGVIIYEAAS